MKKLILFLSFLLFPLILFCQEPTTTPTGWGDVFSNPALWLGSFAGVSLLTAFLAAFFNGLLKLTINWTRQLCAWVIAILILILGDVLNLQIVYTWDFPIWLAILHGIAAGLASNGFFDIPTLKKILTVIEGLFTPKPTQ